MLLKVKVTEARNLQSNLSAAACLSCIQHRLTNSKLTMHSLEAPNVSRLSIWYISEQDIAMQALNDHVFFANPVFRKATDAVFER